MNGPVLLAHFKEYGTYESLAEQLAITAAAFIVYARLPKSLPPRRSPHARRSTRLRLCALVGAALTSST